MKASTQTIQAMEFSASVSKNKVDLKLPAWKSVQDTAFGFFFFKAVLFIYLWLCWSSLLPGLGLFSSCRVQASLAVVRGLQ